MNIKPVNASRSLNYFRLKNFISNNYYKTPNSLANDMFVKTTNNVSFGKSVKTNPNGNFELNLSSDELNNRTTKESLSTIELLKEDAPEYQNLEQGDKEALKHLVRAAKYADTIYYKQDNEQNLPFLEYLQSETAKGNEDAEKTLKLFKGQKGILSPDNKGNQVVLLKGAKESQGKAFYPADLSKKEFQAILKSMLKDGQQQEVSDILSPRTIVKRDGKILKAVDYTDEFKEEFGKIADELELAAKTSTNEDFNEYLILQAKALRENDPMLDAYADKKWSELQDTPLEFTISRENYEDELTGTVIEDDELKDLLKQHNIAPLQKDAIGIRVGIVNKEGTEMLLNSKKYLPLLAKEMPFSDKYEQNISLEEDSKQAMVDADIVILTGDSGACRAGITIAQNLPNNDKLSLTIGGGRRNVYNRQVRNNRSADAQKRLQNKLNQILNPQLHKYYSREADHLFTIGHENGHSLGPSTGKEALGKYQNIIEENKADLVSVAMLDTLVKEGVYTEQEKKEIITTYVVDNFIPAKPTLSQAHRVRSVMQTNHLIKEGAVYLDENDMINIDFDKFMQASKKMLEECIDVQLSGDFQKGEEYVNKYFDWSDELQIISAKTQKINKLLNATLSTPLADKLS